MAPVSAWRCRCTALQGDTAIVPRRHCFLAGCESRTRLDRGSAGRCCQPLRGSRHLLHPFQRVRHLALPSQVRLRVRGRLRRRRSAVPENIVSGLKDWHRLDEYRAPASSAAASCRPSFSTWSTEAYRSRASTPLPPSLGGGDLAAAGCRSCKYGDLPPPATGSAGPPLSDHTATAGPSGRGPGGGGGWGRWLPRRRGENESLS